MKSLARSERVASKRLTPCSGSNSTMTVFGVVLPERPVYVTGDGRQREKPEIRNSKSELKLKSPKITLYGGWVTRTHLLPSNS